MSFTLAGDNPSLPSTRTQHLRQNLQECCKFWNGGWTKWEAVQSTDKLEAKQDMEKAEWDFGR